MIGVLYLVGIPSLSYGNQQCFQILNIIGFITFLSLVATSGSDNDSNNVVDALLKKAKKKVYGGDVDILSNCKC